MTTLEQLDDALLRRGFPGVDELGLDEEMIACASFGFLNMRRIR